MSEHTTRPSTIMRQWQMLRLIPPAPRTITVAELHDKLKAIDFAIGIRTIQRDLLDLAEIFPLTMPADSKPFGWCWMENAARMDMPGLSTPAALTLALMEQHMRHALPPSTLDSMQPYFSAARQTLNAASERASASAWLDKIRVIAPMQRLLAPDIDEACQRIVYEALMQNRQLKLSYKKRDNDNPVSYDAVHPLAIVQRGQLLYLVCLFADYNDVRTLVLHRVQQAEMLYLPARAQPGFDIDAYIASGAMGIRDGEPLLLEAVFARRSGEHLYETPLSADQQLQERADGSLHLTATVPSTRELQWWLLGLGDGVEVLAPAALREQMKSTIASMASRYAA